MYAMQQIYATVSNEGQLVIPVALREQLGIEPGTRVAIRVEGDQLFLDLNTLAAKLYHIDKMLGCTANFPSGTDLLLEQRRLERERELAKEEG